MGPLSELIQDLVSSPTYRRLELLLLLFPAGFLLLRVPIECSALLCNLSSVGFVNPVGLFKGGLSLCDFQLATLALLLLGRLYLAAFSLAPLLPALVPFLAEKAFESQSGA